MGSSKSSSSSSSPSGYRYYFDILMGLCRGPIDQLVEIRVGDIEAWPGQADGSLPSLDPTQEVQQLFLPGAPPPDGGYADSSGAAVIDNSRFGIYKPNLFGGDKAEGGIAGNAFMAMGGRTQVLPDDIKTSISVGNHNYSYTYSPSGGVGVDVSGLDANGNDVLVNDTGTGSTVEKIQDISQFRGLATLWFSGLVASNNPYPKVWKMRLRRAYQGWDSNGCWYPAKVMVDFQGALVRAMNPAHIIYQILTDRSWGRGLSRSELDEPSFIYAANYMYDEGFGLCLKWSKATDINQFLQTVVDHIGATLYVNRGTGLMTLRLIRDDYDPNAVVLFDYSSGLMKIDSIETAASLLQTNEIIVKWHDQNLDKDRSTRAQNLAAIQATGDVITETKDYPGIADPNLAMRVAARDLKVATSALKKIKMTLDRRAWKMQPGSVLRISAPDKGLQNVIFRVATYDDGTATNGAIKIEAVQDVFGMPSDTFTQAQESTWVPPGSGSAPLIVNQLTYEASYYDMVRGLTSTQLAAVTPDEGGIIVVSGRPTGNTLSNNLAITPEGGTPYIGGTGTFAPIAFVRDLIDFYTTDLVLYSQQELNTVQVGDSAVWDAEIVRVDAVDVTSGTLKVARGCADTIPMQHLARSKLFFSDATKANATTTYATGETVGVQLLSRTTNDLLNPASAPTTSVTITGRWAKPYPPGNVRANGTLALTKDGTFVSGNVVLTWASRNKVLEADQLIDTTAGSVSPEDGTTYTVEVWDHAANTMLRSYPGLTALTFTYTDDDADTNGDPVDIDLVLYTVVNGVSSMDSYRIRVLHVDSGAGGYGFAYGYAYGQAA